ncbi:MAG: hypothetical protein JO034_28130 [Singulisphaera sp.]|nr:hypothetical protein [Singulisphaera sp.]
MLPRVVGGRPGGIAVDGAGRRSLGDAIEEPEGPPQALEVEQILGGRRGQALERGDVVGAAQRDGGMSSIREPDGEVGITPAAQAKDLDALAAEEVMRMGDDDESRRREG